MICMWKRSIIIVILYSSKNMLRRMIICGNYYKRTKQKTPKKVTLQEAMKQKLDPKKVQAAGGKQIGHAAQTTKKMKSQQTNK